VNNNDGTPIDVNQSKPDLDALKRRLSLEMANDVLPAHVDIRFFATDVETGDDQDTIEIEDTLVITEV
jgi:hypothetical protein